MILAADVNGDGDLSLREFVDGALSIPGFLTDAGVQQLADWLERSKKHVECQRAVHKAQRRVMRRIYKDHQVEHAAQWPPPDMKPKFAKLLNNTPNPTKHLQQARMHPAVFRPTQLGVFISDFQLPGWEQRAKAQQGVPRRDFTGAPLALALGDTPVKKNRNAGGAKELELENRLVPDDLTTHLLVVESAVEEIRKQIHADRCAVFLLDGDDLVLAATPEDQMDQPGAHPEIRVPKEAGLVGNVFSTSGVLLLKDAYHYKPFNPNVDKATGYCTKAILALPIVGAHHQCCGVVQFINRLPNPADPEHANFFTLQDLQLVREMLGGTISGLVPLPVSMTATAINPLKLLRKYAELFTPGVDHIIDTTGGRRGSSVH